MKLRLGIPKGSLQDATLQLFARGFVDVDGRRLLPSLLRVSRNSRPIARSRNRPGAVRALPGRKQAFRRQLFLK